MNKLNDAIAKIRNDMIAAHREGWGRETPMSPDELAALDSRIAEEIEPVVNLWMKVTVGNALGVSSYLAATPPEEE